MVGGGGGGWMHPQICSKMNFELIVYCMEVQKFVVITNWLQLSAFTVWKPCGYN